jgi:hypothetical protein
MIAGAAVAVGAGAGPVPAAAAMTVAGVICLRALPRLVGLLLAALAARAREDDAAALEAAARRCRLLLVSLSAGMAAVVLGSVLVLVAVGDVLAFALAAVVVVSLLLQARSYRFAGEVVPPAVAAGVAAVAMESALALRSIAAGGDPLGAVALLVATSLALVGLAATWPWLRPAPGPAAVARLLVDATIAPLALAELGAFGAVAQVVRALVH